MQSKTSGLAVTAFILFTTFVSAPCSAQINLSEGEVQSIAEEALIYAFPMVMAYGIMYEYNINKNSGQYKGSFNQISNESRVFTPKDTTVITPNSDTPYSFLMMDLRAEPIVICVPKVEKDRYYSVQLTDQYTFNFAYIGSRATGNDAGCYAVSGPNWHGDKPAGIKQIFTSETEFAVGIFRTQLFNPTDISNVKKIQAGYKAQTLSQYLQQPAPTSSSHIDWPKIDKQLAISNPFKYLNFLLQFAPPIGSAAVEIPMRERFSKMGITAGKPFNLNQFSAAQKIALESGMKSALEKIKHHATELGNNENGWRVALSGFGNRASYNGNWISRAAAAMAGIYGNDAVEALYPMTRKDGTGGLLDGSKNNYTLTFPAGQLPPVHAFWSITMYNGKTQLLINNPINRYLINSPMLSNLKKNADGSITIYIQKNAPDKAKMSNWLPAPNGPIYLVMRLYWPEESALQGKWQPPAIQRSKT